MTGAEHALKASEIIERPIVDDKSVAKALVHAELAKVAAILADGDITTYKTVEVETGYDRRGQ